jgi:hypothetical protein
MRSGSPAAVQAILEAARARAADETARRCAAHVHAVAQTALAQIAQRLGDRIWIRPPA